MDCVCVYVKGELHQVPDLMSRVGNWQAQDPNQNSEKPELLLLASLFSATGGPEDLQDQSGVEEIVDVEEGDEDDGKQESKATIEWLWSSISKKELITEAVKEISEKIDKPDFRLGKNMLYENQMNVKQRIEIPIVCF